MPRLAFITDIHIDEHSRLEECKKILRFAASDMEREKVDVVLEGGDLFERKSTITERDVAADWTQAVTKHAPLVRIKGNHEVAGDISITGRLDGEHECIVEETCGVHVVGGFVIGCLSWPNKSNILALAKDRAWSHEESETVARDAIRAVLIGLGHEMDAVREARGIPNAPKILLMHAMVRGSKVSTGQPLVGADMEVGLEDIRLARADFYALGHVHFPQEWVPIADVEVLMATDTAPIVMGGSPRRTSYGELEEKSYVIADFDEATGRCVSWRRVKTPCAPMYLLESEYVWENWNDLEGFEPYIAFERADEIGDVRGAEIRLRYQVSADHREGARAAAERRKTVLLSEGAVDVKIEERVIAQGEARAPEVATATTLADKLRALWAARGTTPEEERLESLLAKAGELEAQESASP